MKQPDRSASYRGMAPEFQSGAAGKKHYGTGRTMPNIGKTANMAGYGERDAKAKARREALFRRAGGLK